VNTQKEILPNDVHEVDTNERKEEEMRDKKEEGEKAADHAWDLYCLLPCIGIVLRNANAARCWRTDAIGEDVTTMSNAARRCCARLG
jgi:hypothetical protein